MRFEKIEQLTDRQIRDLHNMYQEEWWTKGRALEDVRSMVEHTDVVVGVCEAESKRLVAFARVLTDHVYKALVLDVIVESGSRGKGLARALMNAVVGHPSLSSVRHFELYCRRSSYPCIASGTSPTNLATSASCAEWRQVPASADLTLGVGSRWRIH